MEAPDGGGDYVDPSLDVPVDELLHHQKRTGAVDHERVRVESLSLRRHVDTGQALSTTVAWGAMRLSK